MIKAAITLFLVLMSSTFGSSKDFNIDNFGAIGDGSTLDTKAIQNAIDACTENGGGRVVIPSGKTYIIGTIYLNNIQVKTIAKDERPPIVFDDVPRYSINEIYSEGKRLEKVFEVK